jgi:hypothetical protein
MVLSPDFIEKRIIETTDRVEKIIDNQLTESSVIADSYTVLVEERVPSLVLDELKKRYIKAGWGDFDYHISFGHGKNICEIRLYKSKKPAQLTSYWDGR